MNQEATLQTITTRVKAASRPLIVALSLIALSVSKANSDGLLYAPDMPESTQPEQLIETLPETPAERQGADRVVLPALKGVVLVSTPDNLFLGGWPGDGGVILDQVEIPGDRAVLVDELNQYLGRSVTFYDLNEIRRRVENWFIEHDLPVIQVIAPPGQDITSGVVQYVVVTGRLGEMRVEGTEHNDPEWLVSQMGIPSGEPLSSRELNKQLDWLNRNPFREVNALLGPGEAFGITDVTLKVQDRKPRRFFTRYENTGTDSTGRNRWVAGFNLGNLWQRDHMFSYQYTSSFNSRHLKAHAFGYQAPLPWQHVAEFSGAYVRSKPKIDSNLDQQGKSWRLGGKYIVPLSFRGAGLPHETSLGFNFKRGNSNLDFGGVSVFDSDTDVVQFELGYLIGFRDFYGATQLQLNGVYSPGNFSRYNEEDDYQGARANASPDYLYASISVQRQTILPRNYSWNLSVQAQLTSDSLLPSEQFGVGGVSTVRGYDAYEALGDQGLLIRNELLTPGREILAHRHDIRDQLQLLVFHDYATVGNNNRPEGEQATNLASAGFGIRYQFERNVTLAMDYGWQLLAPDPGEEKDEQLHVSLELSF